MKLPEMNPTLKRHLVSAAITFAEGFTLGVIPSLVGLDPLHLMTATLLGILAAGIRAGYKLVVENLLVPYFNSRQNGSLEV